MDPLNVNEALAASEPPLRRFVQWLRRGCKPKRAPPPSFLDDPDFADDDSPVYLDPWEYQTTTWPATRSWRPRPNSHEEPVCDDWQREGWEIVSAVPWQYGDQWYVAVVLRKRRAGRASSELPR